MVIAVFASINILSAQTDSVKSNADISNPIHLYVHSAQTDSVKPTFDVFFDRPVVLAEIEGRYYENVIVEVRVSENRSNYWGVSVTVWDSAHKKRIMYSRPKAYLYGFSDGTIIIGKGNVVNYMFMFKNEEGKWLMKFREKGLY